MTTSANERLPTFGKPSISRVLVLGHSGFIGSRLVHDLITRESAREVVGFSEPRLDLTRADDVRQLLPLIDGQTAVVMCAAIKRQLGDNLDTYERNVQMVTNLCRVLEEAPVGQFIYFSSAAVYGEETENLKITEQTPVNPTSYYGIAKYSCERLLQKVLAHASQTSLVILRPALIYGPGDQGLYGPSGFAQAAAQRAPIVLWGDGSERREFLFLEDVIAIVRALLSSSWSGVLNVVSGTSYTFANVVDTLENLLESRPIVRSRPRSKAKVDHGFDNTLLRHVLPDLSFTPLHEGVRRTLHGMQASSPGSTQ